MQWRKAAWLLTILAALCYAVAGPAHAGILWYNGDWDYVNGLANEINSSITDARTYDDFNVPSGGWVVDTVWSNNLMDFTASMAYWEIRSGVSAGNGGSIVANGFNGVTQTPTGRSGYGYEEFTVEVTGLNIPLGAGTYWLAVTPIDAAAGRSFISTTSGLNAVGSPPGNNDNSFFDSTYFGDNFEPWHNLLGFSPVDVSMGVGGTPIPEASTLALFGLGLCGALAWRRRKQAA